MTVFERIWRGGADDDGSVHVLGNGRLCAYGEGPNLIQLLGPPYSGPQWGSLEVADAVGLRCRSRREPGAAIWTHTLEDGQGTVAEFTDLVDSEQPCFVRHCVCHRPFSHLYSATADVSITDDSNVTAARGASCSRSLRVPRGQPYYSTYPFPDHGHAGLIGVGPITMANADGPAVRITFQPGESTLLLTAHPDWQLQVAATEGILATPWSDVLKRTRIAWQRFAGARGPLPPVSGDISADRLAWVADSVAVLTKAQQASEGAVMGGYPFHMAYVRDQYGIVRGLLDLGYHDEAKAILDYYFRVWSRHGVIHNAQPIGCDGPFHIHEEDRSEITGYLINQAFDWLSATGDESLVERLQPMLDWALDAQLACLADGMMPFNGDETYIAAGLLPRPFIPHGSAEATILFVESGRRLCNWAEQRGRWTNSRIETVRRALKEATQGFRSRFLSDGVLWSNQPSLAEHAPRFMHGVCQRAGCYRGQLEWLQRDASGNYLCAECFPRGALPAVPSRRIFLPSVALSPIFVGAGPLSDAEMRGQVEAVAGDWLTTGRFPSQAVETTGGSCTVGYDYGFLLMGLDWLGHPAAERLAGETLDLADATGAWSEVYIDGKSAHTRCRPWESAINLLAILRHLRRDERIAHD